MLLCRLHRAPLAALLFLAACATDSADSVAADGADAATDSGGGDAVATDTVGDTTTADAVDGARVDAAPDVATDPATDIGLDTDAAGGEVTWHGAVRALSEAHCVSCHAPGGIGPFSLTTYEDVSAIGGLVTAAVVERRMPPWTPDPECHPIAYERHLEPEEIGVFEAWAAAGFPEGDAADYVPPEEIDALVLPDPTLSLAPPEAYTANRLLPDDYRCLPLAHEFPEGAWITATDILPDKREIVHHVLVYRVPAADVAELEALDAADAGPGYTCFGGPGVGDGGPVAGWVPGAQPMAYPENSGIRIEPGTRLVMQIHYNTTAVTDGPIPPDASRLLLWTLPEGETPTQAVSILGFANTRIRIDAGDPNSTHDDSLTLPVGGTLIGVAPHMHTLGRSISVRLERPSGDEMCLVDIPAWDFGWQQFYRYPDSDSIALRAGDTVHMQCVYDNSAENQPVVNGEQVEPRDVRWGEGTFDEMCLNYLIVARPYYETDGSLCGGFEPCVEDCGFESGQCYLDCATLGESTDCLQCTFEELRPCITEHCPLEALPLLGCINDCSTNLDCIVAECLDELDTLYACIGPVMAAGTCDAELAACEVSFADR